MKVVIADPKLGKCYQIEIDAVKSKLFHGMKIGAEVDGALLGLGGYKLSVTGGTDKDGFPMRQDVHGVERTRILLSGGTGFRNKIRGERQKKTIRGNTIAEDIAQVNLKVLEYGKKGVADTLGIEAKPAEEKTEAAEPAKEKKAEKAPAKKEEKKE